MPPREKYVRKLVNKWDDYSQEYIHELIDDMTVQQLANDIKHWDEEVPRLKKEAKDLSEDGRFRLYNAKKKVLLAKKKELIDRLAEATDRLADEYIEARGPDLWDTLSGIRNAKAVRAAQVERLVQKLGEGREIATQTDDAPAVLEAPTRFRQR